MDRLPNELLYEIFSHRGGARISRRSWRSSSIEPIGPGKRLETLCHSPVVEAIYSTACFGRSKVGVRSWRQTLACGKFCCSGPYIWPFSGLEYDILLNRTIEALKSSQQCDISLWLLSNQENWPSIIDVVLPFSQINCGVSTQRLQRGERLSSGENVAVRIKQTPGIYFPSAPVTNRMANSTS